MQLRGTILALALVPLICGCATRQDDGDFSSVESLARDRTGAGSIRWDRSSEDAKAMADEVHRLLQSDLSAESAVQIALLNNRSLQATYEELGIAQADVVQAGLLKNPVLDMQIRFPDTPPKLTNLEFAIAEDFLDALLIPARKKLAAAQFEATKAEVGHTILDLSADVRATYFSLVGAMQMLELHREALSAVEASALAASKLREAGNISDLDLLSYQSQLQEQKLALVEAQSDADDLREKLSGLLGLNESSGMKITAKLAQLPADDSSSVELQTTAIAQRLDLVSARQAIEVAARNGGLVRDTRYISELNVGADAERDTDGQWIVGPTLSIPIPLFDQGQAKVAKAQAQVRQAEQIYRAMKTQVRADVRRACVRLTTARMRAAMYRESIMPLRRRIVEQSTLFYNGMLLGVFDLLRVKQDELDAHREYIEATRDYWVAHAELERVIGGRLPTTAPSTQPATAPTSQPAHDPQHQHHGD